MPGRPMKIILRTLMTLTMAITNRRCEDGVVVQVVQEAEAEEPEEEAEEQQKEAERVEEGIIYDISFESISVTRF